MKGIYALEGHVTEMDLHLISLARREFDYLTVAIPLAAGACGSDACKDLTIIRNAFGESIRMSVDFYRLGDLESFLKGVSTAQEAVYLKEGVVPFLKRAVTSPKELLSGRRNYLSSFKEIDLGADVALVIPSNNKDVHLEIDFPKQFIG
jgi:hypothetical protein